MQGKPGKFFPVQCDLQDERSILAMFHLIDTTHGGLHVLINNAGVVKNSTLLDAPTEDWREMLNVREARIRILSRFDSSPENRALGRVNR